MTKIINDTKNNIDIYKDLSSIKADNGDYSGALSILFNALKNNPLNSDILISIADIYAEMGLYSLSNQYWYYYLNSTKESTHGVAFEELGINYFYLNDYIISGYYLNKKFNLDGYLSNEIIAKEISKDIVNKNNKSKYHIVYPLENADFSFELNNAKYAYKTFDIKRALDIYSGIPVECIDKESFVCYLNSLLIDNNENLIKFCKIFINKFGENIYPYCYQSLYYFEKKNLEKSFYYYNKALSFSCEKEEEFRIITACAIKHNDNINANKYLSISNEKYPNNVTNLFFYGISLINLNKFEEAHNVFINALKISPNDYNVNFYVDFTKKLIYGDKESKKILPLNYELSLPKYFKDKYTKIIKSLISTVNEATNISNQQYEAIIWGVNSNIDYISKNCVMILAFLDRPKYTEILKDFLLNISINKDTKRAIIFSLITNGETSKFGVEIDGLFTRIKPKKFIFITKSNGSIFLTAYALCISKLVFSIKDSEIDKISFNINKIYTYIAKNDIKEEFSVEEISVMAILLCDFKDFPSKKNICKDFNVDYKKIIQITDKISGANDDKNN